MVFAADLPEFLEAIDFGDGRNFVCDRGKEACAWDLGVDVRREPRDVEDPVHARAGEEAVIADEEIAAAATEEEHPAVDREAESLQEQSLDPAQQSEGQVGKVDNPDEEARAEGAVPAKEEPEYEIKGVVEKSDHKEAEPPRQSNHQDDLHFPEP